MLRAKTITDPVQWDAFVANSSCCNITQSYEWGTLQSSMCKEVLSIGVVDEENVLYAAMLVLVARLPGLRGDYLYAPRGPVIDDPASPALAVLFSHVHREARNRHAVFLKVEPSVRDDDKVWQNALLMQGFVMNPYSMHIRHEWVLDICPEEGALLAHMKEKWRYNIRLAQRKGVSVREGTTDDDVRHFYELYRITSARDSFPILPYEHYQKAFNLYKNEKRALLLLAEHEGEVLAGTMTFRLGLWSWYMYGASSNEGRNLMPNYLLQWTAIQWAKEHGCVYYNFRGIPDVLEKGKELWGVYSFKQGFGGYPVRFLSTWDYVYRPLLYGVYRVSLEVKRQLQHG